MSDHLVSRPAPIETEAQARDLAAEVDALSDTGRSYMVSWLVFCTDPAERRIVGAAFDTPCLVLRFARPRRCHDRSSR
jgi:hypothetical protein